MAGPVDSLTDWFQNLTINEKKEVVTFLYGGKVLLRQGDYVGPRPGWITRGLYVGPAPAVGAGTCPTCGKPY